MAEIKGGGGLEKTLKEMGRKLTNAKSVRVGFLENATYPDGTPVAMVAAINEFGAPRARIPPRPFFRNMIAAKSKEWPVALNELLKTNDFDAKRTLSLVGEGIKGQLQQSIADLYSPALSPITLMLRKMKSEDQNLVVTGKTVGEAARRVAAGESTGGVSTKPLIETGNLISSVDYEVKT